MRDLSNEVITGFNTLFLPRHF